MGAFHNATELRDKNDLVRIPTDITYNNLKTHEALQRIKMAWIALWFVLVLFSLALLAFLTAIFFLKSEGDAKTILGAVNGVLAWITKVVFSYLFPSQKHEWTYPTC